MSSLFLLLQQKVKMYRSKAFVSVKISLQIFKFYVTLLLSIFTAYFTDED